MSELKVNKISPRSGTAFTLGDSGDTFTVPSGATLTTTNATVNLPATQTVTTELKTNKISPASGTAFTFGDSGDTFTIPSGVTITNNGTQTGFGGTNTPNFRVTKSSAQGIGATTATKITWDTEDYDSNNAFASDKFTVPSGQGGLYFLSAKLYFNWESSTRPEVWRTYLYKNGSELTRMQLNMSAGGSPDGGEDNSPQVTGVFNLAAADYIEVYGYCDRAIDILNGSQYTDFCGFKLVT